MSNATKCDRCGYYTRDAKRLHINGIAYVYDLCPDCVRALEKWMEYHPVTDAPERVTNDGEMPYDTGEKLEAAAQTAAGYIYGRGFTNGLADAWNDDEVDTAANQIIQLLDRQAAITERDMLDEMQHVFVPDPADITKRDKRIAELEAERDEMAQCIQTLEREIATIKEHRAANVEKLHELTDECAELRKYRDEWKGLAEKYRADSIAAQAETERYRAKLGDVLDAIHEAERAAR